MSLGGTFQALGQLFDYWESEHWTVGHVGGEGGVTVTGGEVRTDVELRTPVRTLLERDTGQTPADESVAVDDGALEYTIRAPLVPDDVRPNGPRMETTGVRTTDDGSFVVSLAVSMPVSPRPEAGSREDDGVTPGPAPVGSGGEQRSGAESTDGDRIRRHQPDVPAFDDVGYLRDVYEAYDTFAEMADEVDMDVTAETIRRYMIDAGVHEPTRYNTASGPAEPSEGQASDAGESPVVVADGIGLPDGLSADEFIEIVRNSRTLYEVQREMGVERTTARDLLQEYNLLEFVMGQLALESELHVTREEVIDRIRESVSS